jgi:hypothetical protein
MIPGQAGTLINNTLGTSLPLLWHTPINLKNGLNYEGNSSNSRQKAMGVSLQAVGC